jgi:hypothetical protein
MKRPEWSFGSVSGNVFPSGAHAGAMGAATNELEVSEFSWLGEGPWATFLYGPSRPGLLRVLFAMARANNRSPWWLQIRDPSDSVAPPGPAELGWLDEKRLFFTDPESAKPQDDVGKSALWTVIRPDEPPIVVAQLTDFLRLPPMVQELIGEFGSGDARHPFVIANADRVRRYYPRDAAGVRPVLDAMLVVGALPMFGATSPPGAGRFAFDCVFELRVPDLARWRQGSLFCEKLPSASPFAEGSAIPLTDLPSLEAAFEGAPRQ